MYAAATAGVFPCFVTTLRTLICSPRPPTVAAWNGGTPLPAGSACETVTDTAGRHPSGGKAGSSAREEQQGGADLLRAKPVGSSTIDN